MSKSMVEAKQILIRHIENLKEEERDIREHRQRHEDALRKWNLEDSVQSSVTKVREDE